MRQLRMHQIHMSYVRQSSRSEALSMLIQNCFDDETVLWDGRG